MNLCHDLTLNLDLNHMDVIFVCFATTFFICVKNIWALEVIILSQITFIKTSTVNACQLQVLDIMNSVDEYKCDHLPHQFWCFK